MNMGSLEDIVSKADRLAEKFMRMDSHKLNLDYPRDLIRNIEVPPNPIFETNELLVEQNKLLQEQLRELKSQNEGLKKQAEDSVKEARQNKIFGWVSFAIGTAIGIAGVVFSIIG